MAHQGFFNFGSTSPTPRAPVSPAPVRGASGCDACGRSENCLHPYLDFVGEGNKKILVVVESPTTRDDDRGKLLCGDSRIVLEEMLESAGLCLSDCWVTGAVQCAGIAADGNATDPNGIQVGCCRARLDATIKKLKPRVIVLAGIWAIQSILGPLMTGRLGKVKPSQSIGFRFPMHDLGAWIVAVDSVQRMIGYDRKIDQRLICQQHFKLVASCVGTPLPKIPDSVECALSKERACEILREVLNFNPREIAFDYETTGLKPHREGHRIVVASIAWHLADGTPHAASFPFFQDGVFRALWRRILVSPTIGKIAHNNAFEAAWTQVRAGGFGVPPYKVRNWVGDTCLQAHCLSNRAPVSLKWEVARRFGVFGYDAVMDPLLKSPESEGANGFNKLGQVAPSLILPYNVQDSLYSLVIHDQQISELNPDQRVGAAFFVEAIAHLADASEAGLNMDPVRTEETRQELKLQFATEMAELKSMPEFKMIPNFNPFSNQQVEVLVYDKLKYPPHPELGRGVDEEALEYVELPFLQKLIQLRQCRKLLETYVEGFKRESVHGVVHPFFHLHKVDTFRGSSSEPNFQNIPKRNKFAQKTSRKGFRPDPGNRIGEYDYKSVEVCISACYHKDPAMITYIKDPSTDMHRDTAMGLFLRELSTFTKEERGLAKNGYVFPAFYGSLGGNMAHNLWVSMPSYTREHLASKGLVKFEDFQQHVIDYDTEFWENRFPVYNEWRNRTWRDYQKKGYIDLYTGFRMYGPLKRTQATNGQIQGTAFHCLLRTLSKAAPEIKAISGKSRVIGQIHDAAVLNYCPDDEAEIDRIIKYYGTEEIREYWPWIIVPLTIEKDRSEIDGSWAEMTACGAI